MSAVRDIPEEMVEAAARNLTSHNWDGLEVEHRRYLRARAWQALDAALAAGYELVALPAQDDTNERLGGVAEWSVPGGVIGVYGDGQGGGVPVYVSTEGGHMTAADTETEGAALIAAARFQQRGANS